MWLIRLIKKEHVTIIACSFGVLLGHAISYAIYCAICWVITYLIKGGN